MRVEFEAGVGGQVNIDAARTGLEIPPSGLLPFDVDSSAAGMRLKAPTHARCANRSAAGTCRQITFEIPERDASGPGSAFNRPGDAFDRLAAGPRMRTHVGLRGHGNFIADGNVMLAVPVGKLSYADRLPGLFDGRIRFNSANGLFGMCIRRIPVVSGIDSSVNLNAPVRPLAD